jgi:hypothetical protein
MAYISENGEQDIKLIPIWQLKDSTFTFRLIKKLDLLLEETISIV